MRDAFEVLDELHVCAIKHCASNPPRALACYLCPIEFSIRDISSETRRIFDVWHEVFHFCPYKLMQRPCVCIYPIYRGTGGAGGKDHRRPNSLCGYSDSVHTRSRAESQFCLDPTFCIGRRSGGTTHTTTGRDPKVNTHPFHGFTLSIHYFYDKRTRQGSSHFRHLTIPRDFEECWMCAFVKLDINSSRLHSRNMRVNRGVTQWTSSNIQFGELWHFR